MDLPISNEKVLKLLNYSFTDVDKYDDCTDGEKEIISEDDFKNIKEAIKEVE